MYGAILASPERELLIITCLVGPPNRQVIQEAGAFWLHHGPYYRKACGIDQEAYLSCLEDLALDDRALRRELVRDTASVVIQPITAKEVRRRIEKPGELELQRGFPRYESLRDVFDHYRISLLAIKRHLTKPSDNAHDPDNNVQATGFSNSVARQS